MKAFIKIFKSSTNVNKWKKFDGRKRQAHTMPCDTRWRNWLSCVAFLTQNFKPLLAFLKTLEQGAYVEKAVNLMGDSAFITEMGLIYSLEFVEKAITLSEASDFSVSKDSVPVSLFQLERYGWNWKAYCRQSPSKFDRRSWKKCWSQTSTSHFRRYGRGGTYASINFQKCPVFFGRYADFAPCWSTSRSTDPLFCLKLQKLTFIKYNAHILV